MFLYDRDLRHEKVKPIRQYCQIWPQGQRNIKSNKFKINTETDNRRVKTVQKILFASTRFSPDFNYICHRVVFVISE